ncbi:TBC domain containing protein [Coccidioides posadasii C735 delta SOWgp]|uniref:TBC domain containing protein n=1 Tax=Coccidioides posadasii (strain C735) TaxID=222929 RepID=C5P1Z3_COCP7|nr:TBC domain containing protein [Coccidioides posadasii C735 delta SOWgp]EER28896.1 TBC domain containing protein [Coccidioides posadasii C735 delta SOWgp]|eukprot:XP_003071041.1 TBC domain containing protein [Coccidioides posadasii C735 delta SOWgp]
MESTPERASRPPSLSIEDPARERLPTDSMVTVPLSDLQPSPREIDLDRRFSEITSISPASPCSEADAEAKVITLDDEIGSGHIGSDASSRRESSVSAVASETVENKELDDARSVDWVELEKTEELQSKSGPADDASTALLLARLEQENDALATDPKSALSGSPKPRRSSRPPSIHQLKKLVNDPRSSLRYSQLPTPQMTELEFWAAIVADYPRTAQRLPTLTSNKIRGGVPPPLRGVVWPSIAGARDVALQEEFDKLSGESSPYEGLIGKDIGRSFPNVEMFRDPNGEGQQMLAKVLKCFSLHDTKIGYCQGLGFVVGPLLMHMSEAEAFSVLVRLMDHYDLRSCFLPTLSGLHLRIYQFQTLLSRHRPNLHAHLEALNVEPVYVSQWFLSFFAVTCPLPMLLRIYDVLLLEGACETLMRVALSLMQRNEKKLLACHEFEDVMQLLLSRSIWDPYCCNADDLVNDFVSLTSLVTRESLQALEASYKESQGSSSNVYLPQLQAVASRFLGRLWAGSNAHNSTKSLVLNPGTPFSPSAVRRTPSKQSMASTLNSFESTSDASTAPTELSLDGSKRKQKSTMQNKDKDLHTQIEDLLIALTDMQREHATLAKELQKEREEREEDQQLAKLMLGYIKEQPEDEEAVDLIAKANSRFSTTESRRLSMQQTKQQLRDDIALWREKYEIELARCQNLSRTIDDHEHENNQLKEQLRDARSRIQDAHRDKQRLERTIQELRSRKQPPSNTSDRPQSTADDNRASTSGLREFKLGKASTISTFSTQATSPKAATFAKRTSSLGAPTFFTPPDNADEDSLLAELVNAKTSEAIARQELDEVKAKLENLRKLMSKSGIGLSTAATMPAGNMHLSAGWGSSSTTPRTPNSNGSSAVSAGGGGGTGGGGFFSGWTKRTLSSGNISIVESK